MVRQALQARATRRSCRLEHDPGGAREMIGEIKVGPYTLAGYLRDQRGAAGNCGAARQTRAWRRDDVDFD